MSIDTYEKHQEAQGLLEIGYLALANAGYRTPVPECCQRTPVVSYTEAEYIRDRLHLHEILPSEILSAIKKWTVEWDGARRHQNVYSPVIDSGSEVKALRQTPCPLFIEGKCMIAGLEPLACRGHEVPSGARSAFDNMLARVFQILPQKTGFLPTQLWSLLDLEGFMAAASAKQIPDAVLAKGGR